MTHFDLLLVGAGPAHLGVLRRWALNERPAGRIALLASAEHAWHVGMLPGLVAGRYTPAHCQIELAGLCQAAQVELIVAQVEAFAAASRQVTLVDGRVLEGNWLSLNAGELVACPPRQGEAMQVLAVKPVDAFISGWQQWQQAPQALAILGGGVAGVEMALALAGQVPQVSLFCGEPLLAGHSPGLRMRALGHLRMRRVQVREHCPISRIDEDCLMSGESPVWRGRRLLLASGAQALPWIAGSGVGCDAAGFIHTAATLQSHSHPQIFAVGDCASMPGVRKSGLYSLRQVPVLAANLAAALRGTALRPYKARAQGPLLLACGDGGALLGWREWSAGGQFYGRCKDYLDRAFVQRHRLDR
ncbi:FAD-dependent oxidoreductase [Phytopseudomonas dryadis]|uniref:Pyridine nucleotide-disulfide oxidoreductase n=1 Tax=Phytopseudomonas dryadis TaxID=2487520 RepID=A0ABY1Z6Q8_9GAMM|nr:MULTISPECIES: FAD-dependent oxidoreductase [Pseudomonas]TBV06555.1 pyridine nucleotide-disulfide oxidoreductase [Pseudomonas dryadis]TBV18022.1 pyridine nucleotide-disulfide oxidoreductase [Pseudomonas sp. FRB 230]